MSAISRAAIDWRYINLKANPERAAATVAELSRAGISAERFEARTGDQYDGPQDAIAKYATAGSIGCTLSHVCLIEQASKRGHGIVGIVEDDVVLCDDFQERLQYIEENFRKPWDMFFFGGTYHTDPTWHKDTPGLGRDFELTDTRHIVRTYGTWCSYAYLLNCRSAGKVLDAVRKNMHRSTAIDHLFILIEPELQCYGFTPGMAIQRDGWSTITHAYTEFSGFLPLGPHIWAKRLPDFDWDAWVGTVPAVSRLSGGGS